LSQNNKPVHVSEDAIRRTTAAYYGMIDQVDTYFGQILEKLQSLGEDLDDWIIVYTSDHSEMLGQHGIWEKTRFYEGSVRVPLIIRWPRQFEHRIVDQNVNLCDLFATLCDLAGLDIPDNLDSRSLVPLMKGNATGWNNESISQFNKSHVMIKRDHLKYQYYGEDIPEVLFDLESVPGETCNIATSPEYAAAMQEFRSRLAELGHGPDADPNYKNAGYDNG
jgi:choline-sulfatase